MGKKPIVVTMGEPSGISSEIILKSWLLRKTKKLPPFFLVDCIKKLEIVNRFLNLNVKFKLIEKPIDSLNFFKNYLPVIDMKSNINFRMGIPSVGNSEHIINSIKKSFDFVRLQEASGMVTLPVCKKTLKKYGFKFNGQTEYISYLSKKKFQKKIEEIMILSTNKPIDKGPNLIVGLITTHIPLKNIFKEISKERLIKKIIAFNNSLKKIWRIKKPKIAITSINPHSGEGGLIGDEEKKLILPILNKMKLENINILGPLSSDSCFFKEIRSKYDGILCFYHDQGLAPIKILDFHNSVNITGNLPILRVSPDHGPAFDIANKNVAKTNSLIASIKFLEKYY